MKTTPSKEAREAAAQLAYFTHALAGEDGVARLQASIRNGDNDRIALVQAFHRFQLEERERCAKAARDAITCGGLGERSFETICADAAEAAIRQQGEEQ